MSDATPEPILPIPPTPLEAAVAPVKPAKPEPVGDYDDSMLSHLGLPFYYRHAPALALRRTGFWLAFIGLVLMIVVDLLRMPYAHDTVIYRVRTALFDTDARYRCEIVD